MFQEKTLTKGKVLNGHVHRLTDALHELSFPTSPEERFIKVYNMVFNDEQEFENVTEKFLFKTNKLLWLKYCNLKINTNKPIQVDDEVVSLRNGFGNRYGGVTLKVIDINPENKRITLESLSGQKYLVENNNWFLSLLKV